VKRKKKLAKRGEHESRRTIPIGGGALVGTVSVSPTLGEWNQTKKKKGGSHLWMCPRWERKLREEQLEKFKPGRNDLRRT